MVRKVHFADDVQANVPITCDDPSESSHCDHTTMDLYLDAVKSDSDSKTRETSISQYVQMAEAATKRAMEAAAIAQAIRTDVCEQHAAQSFHPESTSTLAQQAEHQTKQRDPYEFLGGKEFLSTLSQTMSMEWMSRILDPESHNSRL
jgi:uncharacterized protein (DUF2147 family)